MKALFIGRFQPFHLGHLKFLKDVYSDYDELIIGIGSSQLDNTPDNPFSADERRMMVEKSLEGEEIKNYKIIFIPDINNYPKWVAHVVSIVPNFDVVVSSNPLTMQLFDEKGYAVRTVPIFNKELYSGKEIRRRMVQNETWENLVPKPVVQIIKNISGIKRLKTLCKN
jgi:nicotinamide-nucleotide adenylyltransferase